MSEAERPFRAYDLKAGGRIVLYLGDSMRGMDAEYASTVDVIVTSPPYNIGKKYGAHRDNLPRNEYLDWMRKFGAVASRSLRNNGSLFLNVGGIPEDPWIAWDVARAVGEKMVLQNVIHWIKSISIEEGTGGTQSVYTAGHFKPIVSRRYLNDCQEYIFHFTHHGNVEIDKLAVGVPYKDKSNIGRWKSAAGDLRDRGNTWFIPYETIRSRSQRPHPATFPQKLPEMCIRLHGLRHGMIVADPFMGIGSTAAACARLGVSFVGYDIDEAYLRESCTRLEAILGAQQAGNG